MEQRASDSGLELVLDNRKLILAFLLLIVICGCFFVIGFVEGRRQGIEVGQRAATTPTEPRPVQSETKPPVDENGKKSSESSVHEQLDWYKSVSGRPEGEGKLPPASKSGEVHEAQKPVPSAEIPKPSNQAASTQAAPPTYSVQVGAFRQRHEAEVIGDMLKAKGYPYKIEPPAPPEGLFLLKVGKFDARADAVAMQLRLKKDGFTSFIKAN